MMNWLQNSNGCQVWTFPSPSPQPSPEGRGRIFASRTVNRGALGIARRVLCDSLSLGERAGVRENRSCVFKGGQLLPKARVPRRFALGLVLTALLACVLPAFPARAAAAADSQSSLAEKQRSLICVLQTNAPPAEKALACKQLAIYGTKDAVPALAPLLADPQLASWARIALEAIPDPAADAALRDALDKLQGKLLVGTINSISVKPRRPL